MKARSLPPLNLGLVLGLALLASACGGKGGAGISGQSIRAATSYNLSLVPIAKRWTPKAWSGPELTGGTLASTSFAGAVTVVNFWASWCGPCRAEQPALEKIYKEYEAKGVRFVGINIRDHRAEALAHVGEFSVTYPSVFNQDSTIAFGFRVLFIPETYVLDPTGRVAARVIGVTHEADLRSVLDQELSRA